MIPIEDGSPIGILENNSVGPKKSGTFLRNSIVDQNYPGFVERQPSLKQLVPTFVVKTTNSSACKRSKTTRNNNTLKTAQSSKSTYKMIPKPFTLSS